MLPYPNHPHCSIHQVRHVTHEVRTPLNTVAIGADVLTHEVKTLGDLIPPLMMELVVGIKEASAGTYVVYVVMSRVLHIICSSSENMRYTLSLSLHLMAISPPSLLPSLSFHPPI